MKKLFKIILSVLILCLCVETVRADSGITYKGGSEIFIVVDDSNLFDNFANVMPGDELESKFTITNAFEDADYVEFYLSVLPHGKDNPMTVDEKSIKEMEDFMSQLTLSLTSGKKEYYSGEANMASFERTYLGKFELGDTVSYTVHLSVPVELGNEYADRQGEVDWIFEVIYYKDDKPYIPDTSVIGTKRKDYTSYYIAAAAAALFAVILIAKKRREA